MNFNEQDRPWHPSLRSGSDSPGTEIIAVNPGIDGRNRFARCAQDDILAPLQTLFPILVVKTHYHARNFVQAHHSRGRTTSSGKREVSRTRSVTLPTQCCTPL